MPNIDNYKPETKALKAEQLAGQEWTLTVKDVEEVKFKNDTGGEDKKLEVSFEESPKLFILNQTNMKMLAHLSGSKESDDWRGQCFTFFPDVTTYKGEPKDCIRIRKATGPPGKNAQGDDDIPF